MNSEQKTAPVRRLSGTLSLISITLAIFAAAPSAMASFALEGFGGLPSGSYGSNAITFTDSSGRTYYSYNGSPAPAAYAGLRNPSSGANQGNAFIAIATAGGSIRANFDATRTLQVGQSLTLSFDAYFNGTPTAANNALRIGMFNLTGTAALGSYTSTSNVADTQGFAVFSNPGAAVSGGSYFGVDPNNASLGLSANTALPAQTSYAFTGSTWTPVTFSIARVSDISGQVAYDLAFTIAGGAGAGGYTLSQSGVTSSLLTTTTFNSFGIYTSGGELFVDNLQVSYSAIPEPSAYTLLLGAGAMMFGCTRRQRRK
jgi:hypothetical protein